MLNINNEAIYVYYLIDMGGCGTCGMGMKPGCPDDVKLYVSKTIKDIIYYCMTNSARISAIGNI